VRWAVPPRHISSKTAETRVNERSRIARDLHDTLLQSFHGLLLRFQTASALLPARVAEAKQALDSVIDQAASAVTEDRDAVQRIVSSNVLVRCMGCRRLLFISPTT
jgi:signal transduction histidine kinase